MHGPHPVFSTPVKKKGHLPLFPAKKAVSSTPLKGAALFKKINKNLELLAIPHFNSGSCDLLFHNLFGQIPFWGSSLIYVTQILPSVFVATF
jgi:hypothetical protein